MSQTHDRRVRPFAEFLQEQRAGVLHAEVGEALNELVAAVHDIGKPGELTLIIRVKPAARNASETVVVEDEVKMKLPQQDRPAAIFFVDKEFNLTRNNPFQVEMFPRAVPGQNQEEPQPRPAEEGQA